MFSTDGVDTHGAAAYSLSKPKLFKILSAFGIKSSTDIAQGIYTVPVAGTYQIGTDCSGVVINGHSVMKNFSSGNIPPYIVTIQNLSAGDTINIEGRLNVLRV